MLAKGKIWKGTFNINSESSLNRTEKQIMPFKATVNWLFNDMWCYLVITFFDWKVGVFQQTVVRVYCILKFQLFFHKMYIFDVATFFLHQVLIQPTQFFSCSTNLQNSRFWWSIFPLSNYSYDYWKSVFFFCFNGNIVRKTNFFFTNMELNNPNYCIP